MGTAGFGGSFAPSAQYEKWEIHPVFPHFSYFRLCQNLSPNLLAPLCGAALIFVMSPATAEIIAEKIGEPTKELEQICICDNTIFWSFDRNKYCGFGKSRKIIFYREQKL